MTTVETNKQKQLGNAPAASYYKNIIESHMATLEYLSRFGNPVQRAKVAILFELAASEG
jgi:hypothetical protein